MIGKVYCYQAIPDGRLSRLGIAIRGMREIGKDETWSLETLKLLGRHVKTRDVYGNLHWGQIVS